MLKNTQGKIVLLLLHIFMGLLFVYSPRIVNKVIVLLFFVWGIYQIYQQQNKNEEALFIAFYMMSAEVFLRMTKSALSWDFGKYATIAFLITGLLVENKKRPFPFQFIIYLLLICVGIAFTDIPFSANLRKAILFNITGPVSLGFCAMYCYQRKIDIETLKKLFYLGVLPVISVVVYIYFRAPSIKEIVFNSAANFSTSGGFGPNQVATSIGFGVFLLGTLLFLKFRVTGSLWGDLILMFYMVYRGLLTFSRGGMLTGVIALVVTLIFFLIEKRDFKVFLKYGFMITAFVVSAWLLSASATGGMLNNRYLNKSSQGEIKEDITTGRADIIVDQLNNFLENPLFGLGVASGDYKRKLVYDGEVMSTSHNEVGRLLEEHGLIGVLSLILLFVMFGLNYFKHQSFLHKGLLLAFMLLWFLTINHSGMRIAFPSLIYGMCLLKIQTLPETING